MYSDITELSDFYRRPLGQMVRRLLIHRLRARAGSGSDQTVIGLGFATPYLAALDHSGARVGALMPAAQGALVWPEKNRVQVALVDEENLPLGDNSVDILLGVHCLEGAERVRRLLREFWRVLKPEGRLILVVANRASLWASLDRSPFGHGRPYSRAQLQRLLAESLFSATSWTYALHVPPVEWSIVTRSATTFERVGSRLAPGIGGVILVEAHKELASPIGWAAAGRGGRGALTGEPAGAAEIRAGPQKVKHQARCWAAQHEDRPLTEQIMDEER